MRSFLTVLVTVAFLLLVVLTDIALGQVTVTATAWVTVCVATTTPTKTTSSSASATVTSTILTTVTVSSCTTTTTPAKTTTTQAVTSPSCSGPGTVLNGQWATLVIGPYTVWNNQWGISAATSGSQTTTVYCLTGNDLSWSTTWNWQGGQYNVKTYSNAALDFSTVQLSSISSIPTVWDWTSVDTQASVYDVSYDTFLSATAGGPYTYEVMVWVKAAGGAGPIGGAVGTYNINGYTWTLHAGPNGATTVYSFVASTTINNVNFDLNQFYKTLINAGYVSSAEWLAAGAIGAGTEPFTGASTLTTTAFYAAVL